MSRGSRQSDKKPVPVLYEDGVECCGCGACVSVCPRDAIEMRPDRYGFLYPEIDECRCVRCLLCLKACVFKGRLGGRNIEKG
ncbi:4Fe-4S dicluster domain-containing protein [Enorma massiliensis]|uniref:4Fe-4S dicluster domain-containing protein n=1 Tax=Enorma massiliensis TaxID=1472761 RepID=UPI001958FA77|nr:4Fe-4S dicluster domain-containing protein [Enorma massiliensis]